MKQRESILVFSKMLAVVLGGGVLPEIWTQLATWKNFPPKFRIFYLWVKKSHWIGSKNTQVKAGSPPYFLRVRSMLRPISKTFGQYDPILVLGHMQINTGGQIKKKLSGSKMGRPLIYCGSKSMLGSGQGLYLPWRLFQKKGITKFYSWHKLLNLCSNKLLNTITSIFRLRIY